jgi:hypothetical protein
MSSATKPNLVGSKKIDALNTSRPGRQFDSGERFINFRTEPALRALSTTERNGLMRVPANEVIVRLL